MNKQASQSKPGLAGKKVRITGDASPPANNSPPRKQRPSSATNHLDPFGNDVANNTGFGGLTVNIDYDSHSREELERMLEARQKSYIERERVWKIRIQELEEELAAQKEAKTGWMKTDVRMKDLKKKQGEILHNVNLVQDRTARILQEQERDLLRAFRARLFDVQAELEKEKNKKDESASAWIKKNHDLEAEVEWTKEVADRLERVNQTLLQENTRLKSQFHSQEEDRNFLIEQLVSVKKDNARLRAEFTELQSKYDHKSLEFDKLQEKFNLQVSSGNNNINSNNNNANSTKSSSNNNNNAVSSAGGPNSGVNNNNATGNNSNNPGSAKIESSEERYKDYIFRLRTLLEEERKALKTVRKNYENELKIRTDMELLLRQCVEDVRKEIARRYVVIIIIIIIII
jgi:hypothetical protein